VRGQAFNFGTSRPVSALELVRMIMTVCNRTDLEPEIRGARLSDEIDRQYLSSARAQAILGWTARVNLQDGLRQSADWYCEVVERNRERPLAAGWSPV